MALPTGQAFFSPRRPTFPREPPAAPLGVFAPMAVLAETMTFGESCRLQAYPANYAISFLLLIFRVK